jgi:hypothetical protein
VLQQGTALQLKPLDGRDTFVQISTRTAYMQQLSYYMQQPGGAEDVDN